MSFIQNDFHAFSSLYTQGSTDSFSLILSYPDYCHANNFIDES